jgi:hypothetical protein
MREDIHMEPTVSCLTIKSRTVRFVIEAINPLHFRIILLCCSGEAISLGHKNPCSGSA